MGRQKKTRKTKSAPKPRGRGRPPSVDHKSIDKATNILAKKYGQTTKQIADYLLSVGARRFLALNTYAKTQ